MVNRKKRLAKGIKSIESQIQKHRIKSEKAKKDNKIELVDYYEKEIKNLEFSKEKKKKLLNK